MTGGRAYRVRRWLRRAGLAGGTVLMLLTGQILHTDGAWTSTDANSGNTFTTGSWSVPYTTAVLADSPLHYFRGEDTTLTSAISSTATDSSGGNRHGVYAARTDSPATHWRFNENLGTKTYDTGGGSTAGTFGSGVAFTGSGLLNYGVTLNGTANAYIAGSRMAVRTNASFTVNAWVKLSSTGAGSVVSQSGTAASGFDLQYTGTRWQFRMTTADSGSATDDIAYSSAAAVTGTWYNVVGVYDASLASNQMRLYVNNVAQAATATHSTVWAATGAMQVGRSMVGGAWSPNYLTGTVDEVRVYPRALSAAEVSSIYNGGNGSESILSTALAARVPGALVGSLSSTFAVGFTGFTGTNNSGATNATYTNPNTFTLECWFRTSTVGGGDSNVWPGGLLIGLTSLQSGDANNSDRDRLLYVGSFGSVGFGVAPGSVKTSIVSPTTYMDGQWHYAAASLGPAGMKLYVDGSLVASNSGITTGDSYTGYWRWGGVRTSVYTEYNTTSGYFTGAIDEVAIYNTQLSDARIAAHYAANV